MDYKTSQAPTKIITSFCAFDIFENVCHPVLIKNRNHNVIFVNQALANVLGLSREETHAFLSDEDEDFPNAEADRSRQLQESVLQTGKMLMYDLNMTIRKNNRKVVLRALYQRVSVYSEHFLLAYAFDFSDIDEKMSHATHDITTLAMQRREHTMAEQTTLLAHHLTQPITAINLFADNARMLCEQVSDEKLKQKLTNTLSRVTTQAKNLTASLDNFRHMRKEKLPQERTFENVNNSIDTVCKLCETIASAHGISLNRELALELPKKYLNKVRFHQVLLNLIQHGIDALNRPEEKNNQAKWIRINSALTIDGNIQIAICTNCQHFDSHKEEKLLDPYYSYQDLDNQFGLSICARYVHEEGGSLTVNHAYQDGCELVITLPLMQHHEQL